MSLEIKDSRTQQRIGNYKTKVQKIGLKITEIQS